jgi:dynein heavy chain
LSVCTDYMQKMETEILHALEKKINTAKTRLFLLIDFATMTPTEMRLNSNTFSWTNRMFGVIAESKQIIAEKTVEFQESLTLRRERFVEELENYALQVCSAWLLEL